MTVEIGNKVPSFQAILESGAEISSDSLLGSKYVIYFYPKDDTPTCTKQACNLRDHYSDLQAAGYTVYGVSPDSEKSHNKFIAKYDLPFSLIVDEEKTLCEAFGVWGLKKTFGREYMGVKRTTFVIDEKGVITNIITKVKAAEHTQQILQEA